MLLRKDSFGFDYNAALFKKNNKLIISFVQYPIDYYFYEANDENEYDLFISIVNSLFDKGCLE